MFPPTEYCIHTCLPVGTLTFISVSLVEAAAAAVTAGRPATLWACFSSDTFAEEPPFSFRPEFGLLLTTGLCKCKGIWSVMVVCCFGEGCFGLFLSSRVDVFSFLKKITMKK